jgi:hypothetical protein
MPFDAPREKYYAQIFCRAIDEAGLMPKRGDSLFRSSPIMGDIWRFVQESTVLLADLTGRNPNVFYELGLAHAIGKPVVLIAETMDDVPFDLRGLRVLTFDRNDPDWGAALRERISKALKETLADVLGAVPSMFIQTTSRARATTAESSLELQVRGLAEEITALRREVNTKTPKLRPLTANQLDINAVLVEFLELGNPPSEEAAVIIANTLQTPVKSAVQVKDRCTLFELEDSVPMSEDTMQLLQRRLKKELNSNVEMR